MQTAQRKAETARYVLTESAVADALQRSYQLSIYVAWRSIVELHHRCSSFCFKDAGVPSNMANDFYSCDKGEVAFRDKKRLSISGII